MTEQEPLSKWVYRFRYHLGLTQEQFARYVGVTASTAQRWEQGVRSPSSGTLGLLRVLAEREGFDAPPEKQRKPWVFPRKAD